MAWLSESKVSINFGVNFKTFEYQSLNIFYFKFIWQKVVMHETPKKSYVSIENYDDIRDITSPRTKRACGRLGIPVSALIK